MILTIDAEKPAPADIEPAPEELAAVEPCPLCEKHRDPATGELRFNAETIAAMREVQDMIDGKIPIHTHTLDELDALLGL